MPRSRRGTVIAQNANHARRVVAQFAIVGQRVRPRQVARLKLWSRVLRYGARAMRGRGHVKYHWRRIEQPGINDPRARVRFADEFRGVVHDSLRFLVLTRGTTRLSSPKSSPRLNRLFWLLRSARPRLFQQVARSVGTPH